MDKLFIITGATLLISFILWWFFGKQKDEKILATLSGNTQEVGVTVNGGYLPNTVVLKKDIPARIIFDRKDPSTCFSRVIFPDFGINKELPVGKKFAIDIDTSRPGQYDYACDMNMFHGRVVIE